MSTFPKEQRFIAEAIERFGRADQVAAFRLWLKHYPFVVEVPSELMLPHELTEAAVAALSTMSEKMDQIEIQDDDISAEHDNDRLYIDSLRRSLSDTLRRRLDGPAISRYR